MIILHGFGPAFGLPDPSPFVTKAELLLKLAGLNYEYKPTRISGMRLAPKGKLPYIEDDGIKIPDSTFIRWHLERKYAIDFDQGLTPSERGIAWAVEKLLEDHVYWGVVYERWLVDENFARGPANFFAAIPGPLRGMVQQLARRKVAANSRAHGMGRHTPEEIAALMSNAFTAVADILGNKPYLMGSRPCGADATVFAFVAGALCPAFEGQTGRAVAGHDNLVAYSSRLMQTYFPQYAPR